MGLGLGGGGGGVEPEMMSCRLPIHVYMMHADDEIAPMHFLCFSGAKPLKFFFAGPKSGPK